jgi:hypothetical protein
LLLRQFFIHLDNHQKLVVFQMDELLKIVIDFFRGLLSQPLFILLAIALVSVFALVKIIDTVQRARVTKREIDKLNAEAKERKALIHRPSFEDVRNYDVKMRKIERKVEKPKEFPKPLRPVVEIIPRIGYVVLFVFIFWLLNKIGCVVIP